MGQIKLKVNSYSGSNTDLLHSITKFSAAFSYIKATTIEGKLTKQYVKIIEFNKPCKAGVVFRTPI